MKRGIGSAQSLVSLLTDFGLVDPFVAEMKVVILSICPQVRIVDVSHGVAEFDIRMGAFLLAEAARSFPSGTVHVAVVDPGVGSSRRGIVVKTKRGTYVGPDNGLLIPSANMDGIVGVFEISNRSMMGREVSSTFHGRDVFAPVAAHIACGHLPEECGPSISDYTPSPFRDPVLEEKEYDLRNTSHRQVWEPCNEPDSGSPQAMAHKGWPRGHVVNGKEKNSRENRENLL